MDLSLVFLRLCVLGLCQSAQDSLKAPQRGQLANTSRSGAPHYGDSPYPELLQAPTRLQCPHSLAQTTHLGFAVMSAPPTLPGAALALCGRPSRVPTREAALPGRSSQTALGSRRLHLTGSESGSPRQLPPAVTQGAPRSPSTLCVFAIFWIIRLSDYCCSFKGETSSILWWLLRWHFHLSFRWFYCDVDTVISFLSPLWLIKLFLTHGARSFTGLGDFSPALSRVVLTRAVVSFFRDSACLLPSPSLCSSSVAGSFLYFPLFELSLLQSRCLLLTNSSIH